MATAEEKFAARVASLGLAKEDTKRLEVALGATSAKEADERLEQLGEVALREMVQWLLSIRRFASVSELDGARVLSLFLSRFAVHTRPWISWWMSSGYQARAQSPFSVG